MSDALTLREAAESLGVHRNTIGRLIKRGELPVIRLGKKAVRVPKRAVDEILAGRIENRPPSDEEFDYYVQTVIAAAPPLSDAQRTKLAELLAPARRGGGAA